MHRLKFGLVHEGIKNQVLISLKILVRHLSHIFNYVPPKRWGRGVAGLDLECSQVCQVTYQTEPMLKIGPGCQFVFDFVFVFFG